MVVVPLCWSCATTAGAVVVIAGDAAVLPLCVCPELLVIVFADGAVLVVELPLFFFAFAVEVVWPIAIDPVTRNALIQKLAANFK
jgi:hypothetical protein